ncbi:MAG: polysaccharide biosynthesis protein [Acholeplasmataceae bacterium]|nr:polysaccharide biosynthesis protein [Acholeplasmataceae bacterium]
MVFKRGIIGKTGFFKTFGLMLLDAFILLGIYYLAKFCFNIPEKNYFMAIVIIIFVKIIIFALMRLYDFLYSHVGLFEFFKIITAIIFSNIILFFLLNLTAIANISWIVFFYSSAIEILLLSCVRFYKRLMRRIMAAYHFNNDKNIPTLIVGAGSAGAFVLNQINKKPSMHNKVIAFIDDSEEKRNRLLNGIPIYGPINNITDYIDKFKIREVIIAISNIDRIKLSKIIETISDKSVKIKRLPLTLEESSDTAKIIDVNINDLLNRSVVTFDNEGINNFINGKTVLVTGGGGSIGSELCKQILSYNPSQLIIFDIYENTTYETQVLLNKKISQEGLDTKLIVLIGSVYNRERIEEVFRSYHPQLVFHAAAYKHVPLMEDSAVEAVRTNVLGTYNVASLANEYEVEKMILVSSYKAVRTTNIMGATKAACEMIIQYFDTTSMTNYAAVRFGNVLGSHGSVVPLFQKQIAEGGPITITHPEITRFFMTISEAVSLILQSAVYAKGGEIFILDMGKPVKIADLADRMIRLSGLIPNRDIDIEYIGLRSGEKLYEELLVDVSKHIKTENQKIYIEEKRELSDIESFISLVKERIDKTDNQGMKELVKTLIIDYKIDCH